MSRHIDQSLKAPTRAHNNAARNSRKFVTLGKRARISSAALRGPYLPPENWYEPAAERKGSFRVVVQVSQMTRKKRRSPCYGMQWGQTIYLYPIEDNRIEVFCQAPKPAQQIEAAMFGARWLPAEGRRWQLLWSEEAIRDFYLNNVLIHELGHIL